MTAASAATKAVPRERISRSYFISVTTRGENRKAGGVGEARLDEHVEILGEPRLRVSGDRVSAHENEPNSMGDQRRKEQRHFQRLRERSSLQTRWMGKCNCR